MVRIRMSRLGRPHRPFYRINAVDSRVKRDGAVIETLGWYDPMSADASKQLKLDTDRVKHWLSKGAQPSDTVKDILAKLNLVNAETVKAERAARAKAVVAGRAAKAAAAAQPKKEEAKA